MSALRPFAIHIPEAALSDLAVRLRRVRWTDAIVDAGWRYGADLSFMQELVAYWRDRFDWRAQEARLNRFPQYVANVDGSEIHFIHARGKGPDPLPLLITHGWPSSVAEFSKIIPMLTDPASFGESAADSFDVIAPSLPGFGFSARPARPGMSSAAVVPLWSKLMLMLGYRKFYAHGGDIGGGVTNRLAHDFPDRVGAIHTMVVPFTAKKDDASLSPAERQYLDYVDQWEEDEGGYSHEQRTRPQTLAFGLNDSPVGLAAWIAEKWQAWSDCGGDPLQSFTFDELLTNISIYWFTQTIGSSMRMYYEYAHNVPTPISRIATPARVFLTQEKVDQAPKEYAARCFSNFTYRVAECGGHFFAAERPEMLAKDMRAFFRTFR